MRRLLGRGLPVGAALLVIAGCGSGNGTGSTPGSSAAGTNSTPSTGSCVQGSTTASGSTALQPLVQQAAQAYAAKCPGATVNVSGGGSSIGLSNVASGTSDIGDSDVPASVARTIDSSQLVDHQVAIVLFSVVVNPATGVTRLTSSQVRDIFTGKATNWKQVGGADLAVTLIERKPGSGTRLTFDTTVMHGAAETSTPASTQDSTQLVLQGVTAAKGGVSYISASSATDAVTRIALDGVIPSADSVGNGTYPFYAHEHMYTKGPGSALASAFIAYISSAEFQQKVSALGFLPAGTTTRQSAVDKG